MEPISIEGVTEARGLKGLFSPPGGQWVPAVVLGDLTLIRPHGMAGIPVVAAVEDPRDVALRSRFVRGSCVVPGFGEGRTEASVEVLLRLGERLRREIGCRSPLVYGSDKHVEMLIEHGRALSEYYMFTTCSEEVGRGLFDKERFYEMAESVGIRVPRTRRPGRDLADLREPLLVKPRRKTSWAEMQRCLFLGTAKARVFPTRRALLEHPDFARFEDDLIIQEHILGDVGALVSFHGFADADGRVLGSFCGRKVRTWPKVAGESSFIELLLDAEVRAAGEEAAARLGLRGPFKIDLIRDSTTGELYVLEVNARFNLWCYLGAVHGVNLPAIAYDYHLYHRRDHAVGDVVPRWRWVDLYRDYKAFREMEEAGETGPLGWLSSLARSRKVYDTFAWGDPAPALGWAVELGARRWRVGEVRDRLGHSR